MSTSSTSDKNGLSYADAGVDIDAGNALVEAIKPAVKSTARKGSNPDIGGFGGLFDLAATGFKDPVLVAANDGVGTKLKIAIDAGIHDTVGIDLVAMCVNDLIVQGAEPLFFLDYLATGKLELDSATKIIEGIAQGCKQAGAALIGGETAEMPGMYSGDDYDLAGFSVGAVERQGILPRMNVIKEGDVLLGLASSGVHSNGFSLVRRIVEKEGLNWSAPAPFSPSQTLGEAFLEPTKIYVKPLMKAIRQTGAINALAHITGGGFTENIPRVLPDELGVEIDLSALAPLPVFGWLSKAGGVAEAEMLRTFNCGVGMVLVVNEAAVEEVSSLLSDEGENVSLLGHVIKRDGEAVVYNSSVNWQ